MPNNEPIEAWTLRVSRIFTKNAEDFDAEMTKVLDKIEVLANKPLNKELIKETIEHIEVFEFLGDDATVQYLKRVKKELE